MKIENFIQCSEVMLAVQLELVNKVKKLWEMRTSIPHEARQQSVPLLWSEADGMEGKWMQPLTLSREMKR